MKMFVAVCTIAQLDPLVSALSTVRPQRSLHGDPAMTPSPMSRWTHMPQPTLRTCEVLTLARYQRTQEVDRWGYKLKLYGACVGLCTKPLPGGGRDVSVPMMVMLTIVKVDSTSYIVLSHLLAAAVT